MSKEVLTPDVIEELPLEKVIENTLVKNNVTDQVIKSLKKQYGGMQLKSLTDKQGFLEIKDARNAVRKVGILAEKLCKAGRDDANKIRGLWIDKEKEVLAKIAEVQDPLDAEIKKFEDEEARIKELELQRQEEQFMLRQTALLKMEAVYSGNSFTLGAVSYELENIKEADEEIWNDTILPKYKREFAKVEEEKVLIEKQKKEAEEKLRNEQAELLKQQEELNRQREEMRLQQEELNKQKLESERLQREAQEKQRIEKSQQEEKLWRSRLSQMEGIGFNSQFAFVRGGNEDEAVITYEDLIGFSDEQFNVVRDKFNKEESERKEKLAEAARKETLGKIRFEALKTIGLIKDETPALLSDLSESDFILLSDNYKKEVKAAQEFQWKQQEEEKRQQELLRQQEEQSKASDKEKWTALVASLNSMALPEFKSNIYKGKLAVLKEKFEEISTL